MTMEWALYTDLYQLTMAQGYLEAGKAAVVSPVQYVLPGLPLQGWLRHRLWDGSAS